MQLWATAKIGTAMPVVFEPVHAALNTLWAMAKTGTEILVIFELVHAALFKLWDTAKSGTDSAPPVSCHSSEGIRVEDWTPWSPRALSAIAEDAQSGLDGQLNVDPYVRSDQVGPTQPQFMAARAAAGPRPAGGGRRRRIPAWRPRPLGQIQRLFELESHGLWLRHFWSCEATRLLQSCTWTRAAAPEDHRLLQLPEATGLSHWSRARFAPPFLVSARTLVHVTPIFLLRGLL